MIGIVIPWLMLTFVVAYLGTDRQIGGGWAFLWALILSPVIGFVIVALSPSLATIAYRNTQLRLQREQNDYLADLLQEMKRANGTFPIQIEDKSDAIDEIDPNIPAIDVNTLTFWQRLKYGI